MTDRDFDAFLTEFRRLASALQQFKQTPTEITSRADAYFHVLKSLPLTDVIAKADRWLATETKFPKPAEWKGIVVTRLMRDVRSLGDAEARELFHAERHGYEGESCHCDQCVAAGLPDRAENKLRYVPIETETGVEQARRLDGTIVTVGHWIHGAELVRWYLARANFYALAHARFGLTDAVLMPEAKPRTNKQKPVKATVPVGRDLAPVGR